MGDDLESMNGLESVASRTLHVPSTETPSDARGIAWLSDPEILALCSGYALGTCSLACRPLWVAATLAAHPFWAVQVGLIASGEAVAMVIGVLTISSLGKRAGRRWIALTAASIAVISNMVAMYNAIDALVLGRLLSGLATGVLVAWVTRAAACRQDAQKSLAMMQGAAVLLITVVFFVSPWFIDRLGPPGFFVILAGLSAVMVVTILACAPAVSFSRTVKARVTRVIKLVPLMGCVAVVALFTGQGTIGTYIITIGNAAGFDSHTLSTVLAVSLPVGLLGPIAARALGARVGLVRTLLLALLLLAISDLLVVKTRSLIAFSLLYAGLGLLVEFCVPYAIALLSRLDQLGRAASAAPACMIGGLAIGPALGARVVAGATDFQTLAFVSASCVAAAVALFAISAGLSGSPQEDCEPHGRGFTKGFEAAAAVTGPSDRKA